MVVLAWKEVRHSQEENHLISFVFSIWIIFRTYLLDKNITIIGAGSLGSYVASELVKNGAVFGQPEFHKIIV